MFQHYIIIEIQKSHKKIKEKTFRLLFKNNTINTFTGTSTFMQWNYYYALILAGVILKPHISPLPPH